MNQIAFDFDKVQPQIVHRAHDEELKLRLGEFAGPLDLLLHLIKKEQVNIYDIPIARITNEYLRYLQIMKSLDISIAGDFLVMAAQLLEIKSKMLLPRDPVLDGDDEPEIDLRRELVHRLLEHQKFKSAAQMLWEKNTIEASVFPRGKTATDTAAPEVNAGMFDLLETFQKILARRKAEIQLEIARDEMSLAEMLETLKTEITKRKSLNLNQFFGRTRTRRELILAFLAVLELVKTHEIELLQTAVFGEILLTAAK